MKLYNFTVIFSRDEDDDLYVASVPALPGCHTEGRTLEETIENIKDAIRAYCVSLVKHGEPIPTESMREQFVGGG